jgi:ADP-ribose pyrophosphatase
MSEAFKLLSARTLLTSRVFAVHAERWRAPDGKTFDRHTIVHPGAVAILPFDARGHILLIRQFRAPARRWLLEIPAGTLEKGEGPRACAKRELIEESGFAAKKWRKLGVIFNAPGYSTEQIHLYRAWDLSPAYALQDEDEHIRLARLSPAALRRALASGRLRDAKTLSAILLAEQLAPGSCLGRE